MKIQILLQGRFPTEKAYGVTTTGTINSLLNLGHEVTVYSLDSDYKDSDIDGKNYHLQHYIETKFSKRIKKLAFSGVGPTSKLAWVVFWKLVLMRNRKELFSQKTDLYWIRDFTMLSFIPHSGLLIYELHKILNYSRSVILKFKYKKRITLLAPISQSIQNSLILNKIDLQIIPAPMGIQASYVETTTGVLDYLVRIKNLEKSQYKGLKVGYVGKFSPNGYSKGIEDLLNLAAYNAANSKTYEISITGGSLNEVASAMNTLRDFGLSKNEIEINGHISHAEAIRKMKCLDVLVLPMPASKKYMGFPLKAIESIASGRIVVAARCKIYQDIFDDSFEPYWYEPNDVMSLNLAIIKALNDESLGESLAKGLEFSSRFTWDARTKKLLDGLISSQDKLNS